MKVLYTVVTRKGQVTVPAEIREALGLKEGDRVAWSLSANGHVQANVWPVRSVVDQFYGIVPPRNRPEDLKQLRREAEDAIAENAALEGRPAQDAP